VDDLELQQGGYYVEPPQLLARNLSVGARLFVAAEVFFFGTFLFAYFYLRELDVNHLWHPGSVNAPVGLGAAISACVVAAALVQGRAIAVLRGPGEAAWRPSAGASLLLALAALGLQCYEWATIGFGPGDGSFASVFVAWTGFYMAFGVLGGLYWSETVLATSIRQRGHEPGLVVTSAEAPAGARGARSVVAPSAEASAMQWYLLAVVAIVMFVLLYAIG
jgi:heme/copper-type cytochrome/quinol oxidase subunit 3